MSMPDAGRVVSGLAKGTRLEAPGARTRPLSDRVKQALFGALEAEGVLAPTDSFLDLFAGSGAAGIEALSRGAGMAVLVERDRRTCAVIEANLRRAALTGGRVVCADAVAFLDGEAATSGAPFSAVLIDPPYAEPLLEPALARVGETPRGWLTEAAIVVGKHFWRDSPPPAALPADERSALEEA
jgi:16S rRNA (guanine966-N2)-methyltransferase